VSQRGLGFQGSGLKNAGLQDGKFGVLELQRTTPSSIWPESAFPSGLQVEKGFGLWALQKRKLIIKNIWGSRTPEPPFGSLNM